jgi:Rrf2 family protein
MKINTKVRYALRAIIEMAKPENKYGILQKDISVNQDISYKYLDPIIKGLKDYGLIKNVNGKKSGYILAKTSDKISVLDVYNAFEDKFSLIDCLIGTGRCKREPICEARIFWQDLNKVNTQKMKETSIASLMFEMK